MIRTPRTWLLTVAIVVLCGGPGLGASQAETDRYAAAGRLVDAGDFDKAARLYEELLTVELDPGRRARILNNLGFSRFRLKEIDRAIRHYSEALALDPAYATCLNNMGAALIKKGRFEQALHYLERGYRVEKSVKLVFNMFVAHYRLGQHREALSFIEQAYALDAAYTDARLKANNVKQGDIEKLKKRLKVKL